MPKTFRRITEDMQNTYSICLLNAFCTTSAQLDTYSRGRQADDKNDKMYKKYATNRQKVCTRDKIPTHTYKGREMNALFHALCGA